MEWLGWCLLPLIPAALIFGWLVSTTLRQQIIARTNQLEIEYQERKEQGGETSDKSF